MASNEKNVWVIRAGKYGGKDQFALDNNCVALGWVGLPDLTGRSPQEVEAHLARHHGKVPAHHVHQPLRFRDEPQKGELVIMPSKTDLAYVAIGEINGDYEYHGDAKYDWIKHRRSAKWLDKRFLRADLPDDIQKSLKSELTIFILRRPTADARLRALLRR